MNSFMPIEKILESISWKDSGHCQYTTFSGNVRDNSLKNYLESHEIFLKQSYRDNFERELKKDFLNKIFALSLGALKNAKHHGSNELTLFTHGIFLGEKGICNGFQDRGKFLRREDIKKTLESKSEIKDFNGDSEGVHVGLKAYIYPNTDLIYVDNPTGVLYCVNRFDGGK